LPSRGLGTGPAALAVRPTRLTLGAKVGMEMTVAKATYVGSRMEYTLDADFGQVFAVNEDVDTPLAIGSSVSVGLDAIGPVLLLEGQAL
jgi:iron(III) transport system ATP-binding protein